MLAVFAHPVKDYAVWRKVFDGLAPMHKAMGIIGVEVFQDPNDPNKVMVIDRYPDMATMERFLANPQFKDAMAQAGVTTPPTVLIGLATCPEGEPRAQRLRACSTPETQVTNVP